MGTLGYSDTQGYIAIPYKILEVVLREGYKVAIRPAVPCSFDPEAFSAVQKLRAAVMLEEDDVAVLQVCTCPAKQPDYTHPYIANFSHDGCLRVPINLQPLSS
jgi:hypothetical protein